MFSQEDSRASLSVLPGDVAARQMTATSGRTCSVALTKSSPIGSLLKTLLASCRWSNRARLLQWQVQELYSTKATMFDDTNSEKPSPSNASAKTLKVTDTKSNRFLFRLVPLEPPTDEIESLLLHTPSAREPGVTAERLVTKDGEPAKIGQRAYDKHTGRLAQVGLTQQIQMLLPTPVVVDNPHPNSKVDENGRRFNHKAESSHSMGLADLAHHNLLPTPFLKTPCAMDAAGDTRKSQSVSGSSGTLAQEIHSGYATRVRGLQVPDIPTTAENAGKGSRLSPLFTEEMMGFPFMWTTLPFLSTAGEPNLSKPTEMQSSHK